MTHNGTISQRNSRRKWIENNKEKQRQMNKTYRENNREKIKQRKAQLRSERENIIIDTQFAEPTSDPESLFCSPKLLDIVDGKYQP